MNIREKAFEIAVRDLRRCYSKQGILAGLNQFSDYWARDGFFASFGALCLNDFDIVKKNLKLFLQYQNDDGQIPIRVGNYFIGFKSLGLPAKQECRARYTQDKMFSKPTDQNSLFIIILGEYILQTKDTVFFKNNLEFIEKAVKWNLSLDKDDDFLIEERYFATWADSIKKSGKVLYTNVLHCESLRVFSNLCKTVDKSKSEHYFKLHKAVKQKINEVFWNGRYYIDWIHNKRFDFFSTDGNVLAILYGIADKKKSYLIQKSIERFKINYPVPSRTNYPKYKNSKVSMINIMVGLKDYHNGLSWLWLGCLNAVAKSVCGMKNEANELIDRIAKVIVKFDGVYEIYSTQPVKRRLYKSENPFAWSSGLFIYAVSKLR